MALAKAVAKDHPTGWMQESEIFLRCIYASIPEMGLDDGMWEGACDSSYVGSCATVPTMATLNALATGWL